MEQRRRLAKSSIKRRRRGAIPSERSQTRLPSANESPGPLSPTAPAVETLADDDPPPLLARDDPLIRSHDQGSDFAVFEDQGSDSRKPIAFNINAVDICLPDVPCGADVYPDFAAAQEPTASSSGRSVLVVGAKDAETTVRAQIDTGAFTSCTYIMHLLHNYVAFDKDNPCPIKLLPASDGSDLTPLGYGYLHVPAPTAKGHIAVQCFYHPELRTTVIDERDFVRGTGGKLKEYTGEKIIKHHDAGTFTYLASHRMKRSKDIVVYGVLRHGKCYTHELIPVPLGRNHPMATPETSPEVARDQDPDFADACERAAVQAIFMHQEEQYAKLREQFEQLPVGSELQKLPFHEYIQKYTPVNTIKAETERLLWHQRLGHPSDYYLYNAHKHVKGVPKFAHEHAVLDKCPTCIQSKQKKEPAGENSTRTATVPFQGLSVDFSFSGMKSTDEERQEDYIGIKGETAWILISDHFSRHLVGSTRVSKAAPLAWLQRFLETHSPNMPNKYVYMDQGGELYRNPKVVQLFRKYNYDV